MAVQVLIADPDQEWTLQTAEALAQEGYEVEAVQNGRSAQLAIYNGDFFLYFIIFRY